MYMADDIGNENDNIINLDMRCIYNDIVNNFKTSV